MSKIKLYLAAGVFNAGERLHNLYLEKHLRAVGYETVLPQREATQFKTDGESFNGDKIAQDCDQAACSPENLCVGCIDGADANSGAAVEFGLAVGSTNRAVVYRTDFRTVTDRELGYNAMFRIRGTPLVLLPCFFTELEEVDAYYDKLAQAIHAAIVQMLGRDPTIHP